MATPSDDPRFDSMFLAVAQQKRGIEPLMDTFFSFLRRKTDFFTGAAPDVVEATVLSHLRRHAAVARGVKAAESSAKAVRAVSKAEAAKKAAPSPATRPTPSTSTSAASTPATTTTTTPAAASAAATTSKPAPEPREKDVGLEKEDGEEGGGDGDGEGGEDGDGDVAEGKLKPGPGNGANLGKYAWNQTLKEVTIAVPLPKGTKSSDVICDISATRIKLGLRGDSGLVLDGKFPKAVEEEETLWTLEDAGSGDDVGSGGRVLTVSLTKVYQMEWWAHVCEGEPEIDVAKVEPENSKIEDLDDDTAATVRKMMFDTRQKAMGKPTSDELRKQDMLEEFMKAHPEMDFSKAKIS